MSVIIPPDNSTMVFNKPDHHFEGPEKLLEMHFVTDTYFSNELLPDLRHIPREDIEMLLDLVNCKIIGECNNDHQTAYILSESSLFLTRDRLMLKTCGTTSILRAIDPFVKFAFNLGFSDVNVCYSRPRFICPDRQPIVHQCFSKEVKFLDKRCEDGASYIVGHGSEECWHVYTTPLRGLSEKRDQTIEIVMSHLDEKVMDLFTMEGSTNGEDATQKSGIDMIFPGAIISDFLFEPCGYSMNGLLDQEEYFTIHITPEKAFSYVSFETNADLDEYSELLRRVIPIFRPKKFFFTFMANEHCPEGVSATLMDPSLVSCYKRKDHHNTMVHSYSVTFGSFFLDPF